MRHRLVPLAVLALAGCHLGLGRVVDGSGDVKTESRTVTGAFGTIANRAMASVEASVGTPASVSVTCDAKLLAHVVTKVDGGALVIAQDDPALQLKPTKTCVVRVTTPSLVKLSNSGAGHLALTGPVHSAALELDISGVGAIDAPSLDVDLLVAKVSGAGAVETAGRAKKANVVLTGTGKIDASKLAVEDATVDLSGAGDVQVSATHSFGGSISGVGHVRVGGNPPVRDARVSGVGKITYE